MDKMPMMVALKVHEFYPKNVALIPIEDEDLGRFSCAVYKIDEHGIYTDVLYELGHYRHKTEQDAVIDMVALITEAMRVVKIMAN